VQDGSPPKKVAGDDAGPVVGETEEDPATVVSSSSSDENKVESADVAAVEAHAVAQ
jgi:hypothetical protein